MIVQSVPSKPQRNQSSKVMLMQSIETLNFNAVNVTIRPKQKVDFLLTKKQYMRTSNFNAKSATIRHLVNLTLLDIFIERMLAQNTPAHSVPIKQKIRYSLGNINYLAIQGNDIHCSIIQNVSAVLTATVKCSSIKNLLNTILPTCWPLTGMA